MNVNVHPHLIIVDELHSPDLGTWPIIKFIENKSHCTIHMTAELMQTLEDHLHSYKESKNAN